MTSDKVIRQNSTSNNSQMWQSFLHFVSLFVPILLFVIFCLNSCIAWNPNWTWIYVITILVLFYEINYHHLYYISQPIQFPSLSQCSSISILSLVFSHLFLFFVSPLFTSSSTIPLYFFAILSLYIFLLHFFLCFQSTLTLLVAPVSLSTSVFTFSLHIHQSFFLNFLTLFLSVFYSTYSSFCPLFYILFSIWTVSLKCFAPFISLLFTSLSTPFYSSTLSFTFAL